VNFIHLASLNDLLTRKLISVKSEGYRILVALVEDTVYAIDDIRSHGETSLSEGSINGDCVKCPKSGSLFRLSTGEALDGHAEAPLATYDVKIEGDDILVCLPV
jgi:nitrite reductase/ring-hydroxylating ferredoxin subunit